VVSPVGSRPMSPLSMTSPPQYAGPLVSSLPATMRSRSAVVDGSSFFSPPPSPRAAVSARMSSGRMTPGLLSPRMASPRDMASTKFLPPLPVKPVVPSLPLAELMVRPTSPRPPTPPVKTDSLPSIRGVVSSDGGMTRDGLGFRAASPRFASPVPLTASQLVAESRDVLRTAMDGPKLDIHNGTELKLTVKRLTKYQDAAIAYFKSRNVESIVEKTNMPSKWRTSKENCLAVLKELAVFHLEKGEKVESDSIDWMNPMHIPIPLLGPVVLLRGTSPHLYTLRDNIRGFRGIQDMLKEEMYESTLTEDQNKALANDILRAPMTELAKFAGNKYNVLLFTSAKGYALSTGICAARHEALMIWLNYIKRLVVKSIKEFKKEMELMELRRRVASLEARLMAQ
jgi:hypothetical protein